MDPSNNIFATRPGGGGAQTHIICLPRSCDVKPAEAEVRVNSSAELLLVDEELAHDGARVPLLKGSHVPDHRRTLQDVGRGARPVF